MHLQPEIKEFAADSFLGVQTEMSIVKNKTPELWRSFMPRLHSVPKRIGAELYSIEQYPNTDFFKAFNPNALFTKWAAVKVAQTDALPEGMQVLTVPQGLYAVFHYKGKPSEAQATFQYIFGKWLPQSEYQLDHRPHFAVMGDKYKGEDPNSEEDFWIPIK